MDRNTTKLLLPIIQAFCEGKEIEMRSKNSRAQLNGWAKMDEFIFGNFEYRIKPEPTYRPFANAEECWQEMLKHQPFGYIYFASEKLYHNIMMLAPEQGAHEAYIRIGNFTVRGLEEAFRVCTFADGTPFGIKEE